MKVANSDEVTPTKKRSNKPVKIEVSDDETPTKIMSKYVKYLFVRLYIIHIFLVNRARKTEIAEDSDDEIVASPVKSNKKLKSDTPRKASKARPPTPGTPEFERLEPITFAQ
jgi:hypothetical protein